MAEQNIASVEQRISVLPLMFGATLFASAFLLFSVQPMVSRMVLPWLGGSPAVWNTCVFFFQAALLLGYTYAHWSATRLRPRAQVAVHAVVLGGGLLLLPLSLGTAAVQPGAAPALWLLMRLTLTIGPPFFAIAATAPLLQSWFARSTHARAQDPYFLYATSNAGSLLALLGYPTAIETTLGLSEQVRLWSVGFAVTAILVLSCGASVRTTVPIPLSRPRDDAAAVPLSAATQLRWITLAFVPSALMLAVTTYITTDIASAPLFWVLPLAIYILTFVLAFNRRDGSAPPVSRRLWAAQGVALAAAGSVALAGGISWLSIGIALAAFGLTAAVCHGSLAAQRPSVRHLTRFYLLISVGGALGGVFNTFAAPLLFRGPWEYPLLLVAACLLRPPPAPRPDRRAEDRASRGDMALGLGILAPALALALLAHSIAPGAAHTAAAGAAILVPLGILLWFSRRRMRLAFGLGCLFLVSATLAETATLTSTRSFFGIYRVHDAPAEHAIALQHGTTMHGLQSTLPDERTVPIGYYGLDGPFGRFFAARARVAPPVHSVGVIGLGTGGLGCYAHPGEAWTFREIDPAVERLARDTRFFHFLTDCANTPHVVLGDARVTLTADKDAHYDLIIIDAFSSDSIPIHLLTADALALYFSHLNPGGVVLFHVSNRFLDLVPVVARLADAAGAPARHLLIKPPAVPTLRHPGAEIVAVAPPGGSLDWLRTDGWDVPTPGPVLWTDERADILRTIRW